MDTLSPVITPLELEAKLAPAVRDVIFNVEEDVIVLSILRLPPACTVIWLAVSVPDIVIAPLPVSWNWPSCVPFVVPAAEVLRVTPVPLVSLI